MGAHLDVIGYLLAAVVFSVAFLIGRSQDATNTLIQAASDASWRIREVLGRGEEIAPEEIYASLAIVVEDRDSFDRATRWVNLGLFVAIAIVFFDGMRLLWAEVDGPTDALL